MRIIYQLHLAEKFKYIFILLTLFSNTSFAVFMGYLEKMEECELEKAYFDALYTPTPINVGYSHWCEDRGYYSTDANVGWDYGIIYLQQQRNEPNARIDTVRHYSYLMNTIPEPEPPQEDNDKIVIVIDPGHGMLKAANNEYYYQRPASPKYHLREDNLTLVMGKAAKNALEAMDSRYQVVLTRNDIFALVTEQCIAPPSHYRPGNHDHSILQYRFTNESKYC